MQIDPDHDPKSETAELVAQIHGAGRPLVMVVTGGGSHAIARLLEVPGASRSVLEAAVPYAPQALARWLGSVPEQFCSARTARAMAMVAYQRAAELVPDQKSAWLGLACTASLASDRPKRGEHRLFVAAQTAESTLEWSLVLAKDRRSRRGEELIAAAMLLNAAAEACALQARLPIGWLDGEQPVLRRCDAPAGWQQLFGGELAAVDAEGRPIASISGAGRAIFPGAFNPLHPGHERMAQIAAARLTREVEFELSIINVDKPPLDFLEMQDRAAQFAGRRLWFTRAETFVKKAQIFPGATFVVGADTLRRIAERRYYGGDEGARNEALREIARQGCRFLVFGRRTATGFCSLADLELPEQLAAISTEVPEADFRDDTSSTGLRATGHAEAD